MWIYAVVVSVINNRIVWTGTSKQHVWLLHRITIYDTGLAMESTSFSLVGCSDNSCDSFLHFWGLLRLILNHYCFYQGKGEFTMEYFQHAAVPQDAQAVLVKEYTNKRVSVNM